MSAETCSNAKRIHRNLGLFDSIEDAALCASDARKEFFGEFWNER